MSRLHTLESEKLLEVCNLDAAYGTLRALNGVSLCVNRGASVAVLGPNGSGKSTLVKAIFGVPGIEIEHGEVWYKGENITHLPPRARLKRGIIYLPQGLDVFPSLTVEENLREFVKEVYGLKQKVSIDDAYSLFPFLRDKRKALAGNLSGGERRLMAIARVILAQPEVALLDEPSSGLSPASLAEVRDFLREIQRRGTTLVLVEQNVALAMEMTQQCVVLQNGVLRLTFPTEDFETYREELMRCFGMVKTALK